MPGLTAIAAYGHTPGHMAFQLASGDARLMIVSDAVAHPVVFFRHPSWLFGFDMDGDATVRTRRRLLSRAAREGTPLFASHMPFPGVGRVSVDGAGFRYTPTPML
jgi:glyoxylase-like metal-dependent hydrolase (beta-lactamase superfamily II)